MRDVLLRGPEVERALAAALKSPAAARPLYAELVKHSRLPGTRPNLELAEAFAASCASIGKPSDLLVTTMVTMDADEAPGATELEFLPICGVYAAGFRAAQDPATKKMLPLLHDAAEDLRFRVRDAVVVALAKVGAVRGDALVREVGSWMDGFFHSAAVLRALVTAGWLNQVNDADAVAALLLAAFRTLDGAARSASRYPGFKALVEAFRAAPIPLAIRFGLPILNVLESLASCKDPYLRNLILESIEGHKLDGRFPEATTAIRAAFKSTAKPVRDPRSLPGPTRRRGASRRKF
ncbi:hypothetical protein BH09MYX1_BH09MYX1_56620 [soil metagenome]